MEIGGGSPEKMSEKGWVIQIFYDFTKERVRHAFH